MNEPIIKTEHLEFRYTDAEGVTPIVLDGVDLEIRQGSFVAVLGHNGSGKSTLAKHLNAILLPSVITCNAHVAATKYAELARAAGIGGSADTIAVRNLKNGLVRLRRELNLPETLAQAGVDPRSVWRSAEQIVKAALEDPCCKTNPMEVEDFLVRRILEEVTGRV